ncbi:transcriptional regulator [Betaproteobacteria bacterium]|nr:transcriptional regulator [Betaproteobacteria bacterium]GHT99175.1 transcriptional regulator [Betaproteobacteria bacterium]
MYRMQRLLDLLQILRNHRFPVAGAQLAMELGVSLRTLYRDINALREQGAQIDGDPGLGFILRPGFLLPPLMFSEEEIEALVLGSRWVVERGDAPLSAAARNALGKIATVLPRHLRPTLDFSALLVGSARTRADADTHHAAEIAQPGRDADLSQLRRVIRAERKIRIAYQDLSGATSMRTIWPFALGYFDHVRLLVAWCELRQAFRNFRTDRLTVLVITEERYPRRRQALLKAWRELEGIPLQ